MFERVFQRVRAAADELAKRFSAYPVAAGAIGLCALFVVALPYADTRGFEVFRPLLLGAASTAALAQFATSAALMALYRRTGQRSAAVLSGVFLAASIAAVGLPAAIPLGNGRDALFFMQPQAAAWLWLAWHVVFPVGAAIYGVVRLREGRTSSRTPRATVLWWAAAGGAAAGAIAVGAAVLGGMSLPPLVHSSADISGYRTNGAGSVILMFASLALIVLLRVKERSASDGALILAVLAIVLETWTNLLTGHRFTVLWYTGRLMYCLASVFVLFSAIRDMARLSERAVALRDTLDRQTRNAERHARRLRALWETNSSVADDEAFVSAVLRNAAEALREGIRFHAFICHRECDDTVVDFATTEYAGPYVAAAHARYPVKEGLIGAFDVTAGTRSWNDIRTDPCFSTSERLRRLPWRALIGAPFRIGQTPYYIAFAAPVRLDDEPFSASDHAYVETLAGACAARLQQRAHMERLRYQTEHDLLTGVYNRAAFRGRGFAAVRAGKRVGLAVVALDGFRAVNDALGHQTGDAVLVEVAARLAGQAPPGDVIARLGGDTFGVLMDGITSRAEAEVRVRSYAAAFRDPFGTGDREGKERVALTASTGIALAPADAQGFEELLARADSAVYDAKQGGRARWAFFDRRIEGDFHAVRRLKDELARALIREELVLHFQPHVDLRTGRLAGAEALLRWNHPERGLLPPAEFVPFAERHGLADELGAWVMRETIRISERWRRSDPNVTVWCNVSQSELNRRTLAARLERLPRDVRGVGVEITEGAVTDNADEMAQAIAMLREAGFAIALDDFGTGYSSLAHLRRLPIDVVKIDRSFVAGIPDDPHDVAIVDAVISIAQRSGFEIVAEGVETMEQAAYLAAGGCTYGQGYLYARPMPADAFERWMYERRELGAHADADDVA